MIGYLRGGADSKCKGQFLGLSKDRYNLNLTFLLARKITKRWEGKKSNFSAKSVSRPPPSLPRRSFSDLSISHAVSAAAAPPPFARAMDPKLRKWDLILHSGI